MNPLKFLEGPLHDFLIFLHDKANLTYGWAIVVLTVCVRILILPLFVSQYRSARRMQEIAPQLKQLQAKFKTDKKKQQEEMMRLFQENKVNPFGSCLPMVFQFPIFIALYYVLRNFAKEQIGGADLSFMWVIPDISTQFRSMGWTAIIVAVIYGGSQLLATEVSMATTPQTNEMQRKLFRVLPLFIVGGLFFYPNVPAGLVLYWMTTNLWTGGQQVVLKRRLGPLQMTVPADDAASPAPAVVAGESKSPGGAAAKTKQAKPGAKADAKPSPAVAAEPAEIASEGTTASSRRPPAPRNRPSNQRRRPPKKR
jgi:YidC/Oxa1 family membrane protein insertase